MEISVEFLAKKYFLRRIKKFNEKCKFVKFERTVHRTEGHNSSSMVGHIVYESEDGQIRRTEKFFLKVTAPKILFPDGETWQFVNEVHFYTRIRPFLESLRGYEMVPKFYASYLDAGDDWVHAAVLLENLENGGFLPSRQVPFVDYDHLALMMKKLGEFHAYSFKAKKENAEYFYSLVGVGSHVRLARGGLLPMCEERWKQVLRPFENRKEYSSAAALVGEILRNENVVLNYRNCGPEYDMSVLGHCAFDAVNVLFRYNEDGMVADAKIVDWQTWMLVSVAMDILTPLYVNASQRMRDEHWDDLIEIYYSSLRDTFVDLRIPAKESFVRDFALYIPPILYMVGYRFPHPTLNAIDAGLSGMALAADAANVGCSAYEDPVVDVFKDMVKRGFLKFWEDRRFL